MKVSSLVSISFQLCVSFVLAAPVERSATPADTGSNIKPGAVYPYYYATTYKRDTEAELAKDVVATREKGPQPGAVYPYYYATTYKRDAESEVAEENIKAPGPQSGDAVYPYYYATTYKREANTNTKN